MILFRYLMKEVLGSLLAVTFVLLLIFLSNQLVRYLSYAASGKLAANILFELMGFEIPYLLALLLPLGFYLGVILAYGRLYSENEMGVMQACGMSQWQLFRMTSCYAAIVAVVVTVLSLWVNPWIASQKQRVLAQGMSVENILATLTPGRFQVANDGKRVIYVEHVSNERKVADNLFFADQVQKTTEDVIAPTAWSVMSAARGYLIVDKQTNQHQLVAEDGYRYQGTPGQNDYRIIQFQKYTALIPSATLISAHQETEGLSTRSLFSHYNLPLQAAELQWRISAPLSLLLLALLAVPMSHIKPRKGRYSAVLPAILLYVIYANLLFVVRNWVEQKSISIGLGLWLIHAGFLLFIILFLLWQTNTVKRLIGRS